MLAIGIAASTKALAAEEPSEQVKRMDAAAGVLDEVMGTPDKGIPEELLDSAKCVAVVPSMVNIGFVFGDRKSTRLNSSHLVISYAVFCLKKKKQTNFLTYILRSTPSSST